MADNLIEMINRLVDSTESEILNNFQYYNELSGCPEERTSYLLKAQLHKIEQSNELNVQPILDLIASIEDDEFDPSIKGPDEFKYEPLKGLWKAHFFDSMFLLKNVQLNWAKEKKIKNLIKTEMEKSKEKKIGKEFISRLAHKFVFGGLGERADKGKLTGEWLIFGKYEGKNYYLAVCRHTADEQDKEVYSSLKKYCGDEYPFLFKKE